MEMEMCNDSLARYAGWHLPDLFPTSDSVAAAGLSFCHGPPRHISFAINDVTYCGGCHLDHTSSWQAGLRPVVPQGCLPVRSTLSDAVRLAFVVTYGNTRRKEMESEWVRSGESGRRSERSVTCNVIVAAASVQCPTEFDDVVAAMSCPSSRMTSFVMTS